MYYSSVHSQTVIRCDERGNGVSEGQVADVSFGAFVRDLETAVDAAGIARFPPARPLAELRRSYPLCSAPPGARQLPDPVKRLLCWVIRCCISAEHIRQTQHLCPTLSGLRLRLGAVF